jgi:recombination protein RecA
MGSFAPLPVPRTRSQPSPRALPHESDRWRLTRLAGRLVEISGTGNAASLTVACGLVLEAQQRAEPVAWVTLAHSTFFPPDAAEGGVDLDSLIVVRVPNAQAAGRAADRLLRSDGFGLVILDLGADAGIPAPLLSRISGLVTRHRSAVVIVTEKPETVPSLSSLVSVRVEAHRKQIERDRFRCRLVVLKDKHAGPAWSYVEDCRGPAGLR